MADGDHWFELLPCEGCADPCGRLQLAVIVHGQPDSAQSTDQTHSPETSTELRDSATQSQEGAPGATGQTLEHTSPSAQTRTSVIKQVHELIHTAGLRQVDLLYKLGKFKADANQPISPSEVQAALDELGLHLSLEQAGEVLWSLAGAHSHSITMDTFLSQLRKSRRSEDAAHDGATKHTVLAPSQNLIQRSSPRTPVAKPAWDSTTHIKARSTPPAYSPSSALGSAGKLNDSTGLDEAAHYTYAVACIVIVYVC